MKPSYYNFVFYDDKYSYWFNSLTHSYFRLSEKLGYKIESLLGDISKLKDLSPIMFDKLLSGGFIIDNGIDELDIIRGNNETAIHSKDYFLIILPTLNCNFKCWYCIQDHIVSSMTEETKEAIKRHIDYMINEKEITSLHIEWFGGEPFMYFKQVIEPLSQYSIEKCSKKGIPFTNSATTNGYFINSKIAQRLTELKFKHFQITIDGEKEFHDKVKYQPGCSSAFEHVLTNINQILDTIENIRIFLRINYTHTTLTTNIIEQVNSFISATNRHKVVITPKKVWQENIDKSFNNTIIEVLDGFSASGYKVQRWSPPYKSIPCYASKEYYNAINFNGHVVKCTACNDLYEKDAKGQLLSNGTIVWNNNFDLLYQVKSFENKRCLKCKRLPVCMGLCPRDYIMGRNHCKNEIVDTTFEASIIDFIKHEYED